MLIVDAYNALQTSGILPGHLAGIELEGLARLVSRSRYAGQVALLVCDGRPHSESLAKASADRRTPGRHQLHACDVLFAGAGQDADSLIERLISQSSAPGRLTVVSTDRRLRKAAARRGAASISSAEFLTQLVLDESRPPKQAYPAFAQEIPLDPYSLAHWMREFGYEPERAGRPASANGGRQDAVTTRALMPLPEGGVGGGRTKNTKNSNPHAGNTTPSAPASSAPTLPSNTDPVLSDPHITDPLLLEALRHWNGRMSADELDMRRWLARETRKGRPDA